MNKNYNWEEKEKRAEIARKHTQEMSDKYQEDIDACVYESSIYGIEFFPFYERKREKYDTNIIIENKDSVSAAFENTLDSDKLTCILNFASYKNPGGMFINGSRAQEECLCHESFLYNVLKEFDNEYFYENNRNHKNKGLYLDRALYNREIKFIHNNVEKNFDVITIAAPNYGTASKYNNVTIEENNEVLKNRIYFLLDICAENKAENLILGAWGCGVFKQDPETVARLFKECLKEFTCFRNIIFAIPSSNRDNNLEKFIEVFSEK